MWDNKIKIIFLEEICDKVGINSDLNPSLSHNPHNYITILFLWMHLILLAIKCILFY